jgi:hypothetical protein
VLLGWHFACTLSHFVFSLVISSRFPHYTLRFNRIISCFVSFERGNYSSSGSSIVVVVVALTVLLQQITKNVKNEYDVGR